MPLTRRGPHCSAVPLDIDCESRLASTLPHVRSRRLIGAGDLERITGARASSRFAGRKQAWPRRPTARPRLVPSSRALAAGEDARF
jgi:hypothetical protein